MDYGKMIQEACGAVRDLCAGRLARYARGAEADVREYLEASKPLIVNWTADFATGKMKRDEYELALRGRLDVAKMAALKQAGMAAKDFADLRNKIVQVVAGILLAVSS
jgi:hypothetical protein